VECLYGLKRNWKRCLKKVYLIVIILLLVGLAAVVFGAPPGPGSIARP